MCQEPRNQPRMPKEVRIQLNKQPESLPGAPKRFQALD